jgi:hypothetical protein
MAGLLAPLHLIFIKTSRPLLADKLNTKEKAMPATNPIQGAFAKFASTVAALRRRFDFNCGDCERSDRCGLPPSDRCIFRAAQIARGDWKIKRRAKALSQC